MDKMESLAKLLWAIVNVIGGGTLLTLLIIWALRTRKGLPLASEEERKAELEKIAAELKLESDQALADHFNQLSKKEGSEK